MNESPEREAEILNAAWRLPADQRAGYLDLACAGNPALRRSIEELLRACEQMGDFLQNPGDPALYQRVEELLRRRGSC